MYTSYQTINQSTFIAGSMACKNRAVLTSNTGTTQHKLQEYNLPKKHGLLMFRLRTFTTGTAALVFLRAILLVPVTVRCPSEDVTVFCS